MSGPMGGSMNGEPSHLRSRARRLRQLAAAIERAPAVALDAEIGPGTWIGPRPQFCADELRRHQRRAQLVADELRWSARRLEQLAASLDAIPP